MGNTYDAYLAAAKIAASWEFPHDKLDNGIILHHVPKDTDKGHAVMNSIRFAVKRQGFTARMTWLDNWTLKVIWLSS